MNRPAGSLRHQRGAVAVIVAIVIGLLLVMVGLVVDLGYLYTRKTELQNAADAAALAGAKELKGTAAGIIAAKNKAIQLAGVNSVDFGSKSIVIPDDSDIEEIEFGPTPDGPWTSFEQASASDDNAAGKFFIKVDTTGIGLSTVQTWFMRVSQWGFGGIESTTTFGMAVAGRTVCEALPMFTCVRPSGTAPNYGFVPGATYRLTPSDSSPPHLGPGNIGWMDPVSPGSPGLIHGGDEMAEIICRGQAWCLSAGTYSSLTQSAFNRMMDALNTRFAVYEGKLNKAEYKLACPADTNIKEYLHTGPANANRQIVVNWLDTPPDKQGLDGSETLSDTSNIVHWAAVRPPGTLPPDTPGVNSNYPSSGSPYSQTTPSGPTSYFEPPPATLGGDPVAKRSGRRFVTLGVASNCASIAGSGYPVEIVAFARFLVQKRGVGTGADKGFYGEFIEIADTTPPVIPQIKLYH